MKKMIAHFQNERGNIALLVMGSLILMMVLFFLIINMGSVLATKEKSSTTAKQASLAATSVVYDKVRESIRSHYEDTDWSDTEEDDPVREFFEKFDEKVSEKKEDIFWYKYIGWSDNEIELEAMSKVIKGGLNTPMLGSILYSVISDPSIGNASIATAKSTIVDNDGTLSGAVMEIKDNQIHIKAANEFKATSYEQFFNGIQENIYRKSSGPEVSFLHEVFGGSPTINLE